MRILSLDFGEKRIGLALSDPLGLTAQGLPSYLRREKCADMAYLGRLCAERGVGLCVVGLPLKMNGEPGLKAQEVLAWTGELKKNIRCPVEMFDERLTTKEATRLMISQGLSRERRKEKSDELAAVLILQNYLEHHRSLKKRGEDASPGNPPGS